ncbi:hypothetical protein OAZ91_00160 [bacterium]|nr:hypothetical protein [bacterium]
MINWPTAFVIAVAICAGAFFYNKPSDAAFGGSDRYSFPLSSGRSAWVQFEGNKQRFCFREMVKYAGPSEIKCLPWKTD